MESFTSKDNDVVLRTENKIWEQLSKKPKFHFVIIVVLFFTAFCGLISLRLYTHTLQIEYSGILEEIDKLEKQEKILSVEWNVISSPVNVFTKSHKMGMINTEKERIFSIYTDL